MWVCECLRATFGSSLLPLSQGPNSIPSTCGSFPSSAPPTLPSRSLPLPTTNPRFVWEWGLLGFCLPHPLNFCVGGVFLSLCAKRADVESHTFQAWSVPIVGHTAGLRRQMEKKRLDHCLFSLIFIVPLLFLPLIISNRKVPFCLSFPTLLQLLVWIASTRLTPPP